jgi:hypothetical protein
VRSLANSREPSLFPCGEIRQPARRRLGVLPDGVEAISNLCRAQSRPAARHGIWRLRMTTLRWRVGSSAKRDNCEANGCHDLYDAVLDCKEGGGWTWTAGGSAS